MQFTILTLLAVLLSSHVYAAPIMNGNARRLDAVRDILLTEAVNERSPDADARLDHAYPIKVEGMLARLD